MAGWYLELQIHAHQHNGTAQNSHRIPRQASDALYLALGITCSHVMLANMHD